MSKIATVRETSHNFGGNICDVTNEPTKIEIKEAKNSPSIAKTTYKLKASLRAIFDNKIPATIVKVKIELIIPNTSRKISCTNMLLRKFSCGSLQHRYCECNQALLKSLYPVL
mmetsp:Transcript_13785/g.21509  ORF Transcript_13785/g.21509 Transcript_13785/m.21509 type:complete len:113 (-) Transcript_13785:568-906(-)